MRYAITSLITAIVFAGILLTVQNGLAMNNDLSTVNEDAAFVNHLDLLGQAASEFELGLESGGTAMEIDKIYMQLNNVNMKAEVGNNVLHSNSTGMNLISSGALADMNGFSTVIQNSGNQVVIQSDLIINMTVH